MLIQPLFVHIETSRNTQLQKRQAANLSTAGNVLFSYTGQIQIGTPPQQIRCTFDSGSFDFWVRDSSCQSSQCTSLPAFNKTLSSSYSSSGKPSENITYADGSQISGIVASETVSVGGLAASNISFTQATYFGQRRADEDSIMGLAIPTNNNSTYFNQLILTRKISSPIFSYFVGNDDRTGGITFGAIDIARFGGHILWAPLVPESTGQISYWKVGVQGITIGPKAVSIPPNMSIVTDTGTSFSLFPTDIANQLNQQLGMTQIGSIYGIPCPNGLSGVSRLPNITISLITGNLVVTPKEYLYEVPQTAGSQSGVCISAINGGNTSVALIGNAFLRRFYLVHDLGQQKLGFAVANRGQVTPNFVAQDSRNPPQGLWKDAPEIYPIGSNKTLSNIQKDSNSAQSLRIAFGIILFYLCY